MATHDNGTGISELAMLTKLGHELDKGDDAETQDIRRGMSMPDQVKTKSGVVLSLRRVSGTLVQEASRRLKTPQPPISKDENTGREFRNELDPTYLNELTEWYYQRIVVANLAHLGLGTSLVSKPDDVLGPDDDWEGPLAELGLELDIPEKGTKKRYVAWLLNYVLGDEERETVINLIIGRYGEIREEAVVAAMASFRRATTGPANIGDTSPTIQS